MTKEQLREQLKRDRDVKLKKSVDKIEKNTNELVSKSLKFSQMLRKYNTN